MDASFITAFNHTMHSEVGPDWDPTDPEVIAGKCATKAQRIKTGYVNHPADPGGETKYGVAAAANPGVNIKTMNLQQAMEIYYKKYWLAGKCDKMPLKLAIAHFDGCVNHGVGTASKFLQKVVGVEPDGQIGPVTIAKIVKMANQSQIVADLLARRKAFYDAIIARKPSQAVFKRGWYARIESVKDSVA